MKERYQQIAQLREQARFLGYEFLSWLFLLLDRDNAKDDVSLLLEGLSKSECAVVLGQRLVTCLLHHKEQKTSITSPILEDSHEVFASLKNGHVIEALAILCVMDETKIALTLNAQDFGVSQAKIAATHEPVLADEDGVSEDDERREEIFLRMSALSEAEAIIDRLYRTFLALRLDKQTYQIHLRAMRTQVERRLNNYLRAPKAEQHAATHGGLLDTVA